MSLCPRVSSVLLPWELYYIFLCSWFPFLSGPNLLEEKKIHILFISTFVMVLCVIFGKVLVPPKVSAQCLLFINIYEMTEHKIACLPHICNSLLKGHKSGSKMNMLQQLENLTNHFLTENSLGSCGLRCTIWKSTSHR